MIYEVHEITKLNINTIMSINADDIIVFDDGLYSQYYYSNEIQQQKSRKYFAISANLVCIDDVQIYNINRHKAMWLYKETHNRCAYMNIEQIKEILHIDNCVLCAHGYNHLKFELYINKHKDISLLTNEFIDDFKKSIDWYDKYLNIIPTSYCFPYNYSFNGYLHSLITTHFPFIQQIFGKGRISI